VLASAVIFLVAVALVVPALILERLAPRSGDYLRWERRAVLAQRLTLAGFLCLPLLVLLSNPLLGGIVIVAVAAWILWWLPESHRRLYVEAKAVFDAPPDAVASVMFDVSQQTRWMQLLDVALETPGLVRVGSVIRQTISLHGHPLVARSVVTELRPYQRMVLTVQVRHAKPIDVLEVAPHERGALVTYGGGHQLSRVGAILGGWGMRSWRRQFTQRRVENLERLRALVVRAPLAPRA
jgi:hypothetical protein